MIRALSLLLTLMAVNIGVAAPQADFYVSGKGSDAWSGSLAAPNAQKSDGPFATLERARDAIRKLKGGASSKDIVVQLREGTYRLGETIVFGVEDGGKGDATVTYEAYPGEKPVFTSGVEIEGWKKLTKAPAALPKAARGKVWVANVSQRFYTLFDAEGMLPRARAEGFTPLDPPEAEVERHNVGKDTLYYPKGVLKAWPNLEDVEIVIRPHHAWMINILTLASVDEKKRVAKTAIEGSYPLGKLRFLPGGKACWVENVLEALDKPGEWVLNTKEGKLYLWPRGKGAPQGIGAPTLRELIRVEGKVDKEGPKDTPVRNLIFRGLTLMHGARYTVRPDDAGLQHDWDFYDRDNALLRLRGAENCVVEKCHFVHSGGGAIRVDLHGRENKIVGNHIEYIGGTGVLLCGYGPGTKDVNNRNLVYNNHIHHVGQVYWHSPGIFVWQSGENRVANNLVHHTAYTPIIISGCMTHFFARPDGRELVRTIRWHEVGGGPAEKTLEEVRPFLHTHDNMIELNEVHHAMELLGDGNGLYVRGAGADNVIRRNYFHHLVAPTRMQSPIRTDGGQRDTLIAENVIWKCTAQGIKLKLNNRVENNIVADLIEPVHGGAKLPVTYLTTREGPMTGATIKRNIFFHTGKRGVMYDQQTAMSRGREPALLKDVEMDHNIYFSPKQPGLAPQALKKNQAEGNDKNSIVADPLFVDPENGDFRLKPGSPALKMGFVPIDMSKIGLRAKP